MGIILYSISKFFTSSCAEFLVKLELNFDGILMPNTFFLPKAATNKLTDTAESIPPLIPITAFLSLFCSKNFLIP